MHNEIYAQKLQTYKSNIKSFAIHSQSGIVYVCVLLFIVCLCICICERLLENSKNKTKHKNNTNCGSAFEPGASGLPYYCTSICVRFGLLCALAVWIQNPKKKKTGVRFGNPTPAGQTVAPMHQLTMTSCSSLWRRNLRAVRQQMFSSPRRLICPPQYPPHP